jgi:O-antigen ligase
MAVLLVAFALLADKAEKPCRPWLVPAIILNLMALYLTNTRMIWPALIAGLILQFILLKKYKTLCFVLGTCVVGLVVIIVAPELFPRLSYSHVEENYNERRTLWMTAVNYIKENPVFGQGALSFREHVWKTWPRRTHPHNLFLTLWVDYGFFGMLALICATVMSIATSIKIQIKNFCNVENAVFLAYIIGIFIFGITDNPVINLGTGFVFSFMMAVPYIVKNNELVNNGQ